MTRKRSVSEEERKLFETAYKEATPLAPALLVKKQPDSRSRATPGGLNGRTAERLKRGEIDPQARLDLHGMTESAAHRALITVVQGAWRNNYAAMPWMVVAPSLAIIGSIIAYLALDLRARMLGLFGSSLAIFGIISTAGLSLFPFLMPSSVEPNASFTVWDASSSQMTLFIMLCATVFFLPIVLAYTAWVYRVMRGTVTTTSLNRNPNAY